MSPCVEMPSISLDIPPTLDDHSDMPQLESGDDHSRDGSLDSRDSRKEKMGKRYLETTDLPTACKHNRWTLQMKTKRFYLFRCMVCSKLWKTKFKTTRKCIEFFMGHCPLGDDCPKPHIYSKNRRGVDVHTSLESFRSQLGDKAVAAEQAAKAAEGTQCCCAVKSEEPSDDEGRMTTAELGAIVAAAMTSGCPAAGYESDGTASSSSPPPLEESLLSPTMTYESSPVSAMDEMPYTLDDPAPALPPQQQAPYDLDSVTYMVPQAHPQPAANEYTLDVQPQYTQMYMLSTPIPCASQPVYYSYQVPAVTTGYTA